MPTKTHFYIHVCKNSLVYIGYILIFAALVGTGILLYISFKPLVPLNSSSQANIHSSNPALTKKSYTNLVAIKKYAQENKNNIFNMLYACAKKHALILTSLTKTHKKNVVTCKTCGIHAYTIHVDIAGTYTDIQKYIAHITAHPLCSIQKIHIRAEASHRKASITCLCLQ
jgi:transcription elongation factor Elf1